MVPLSITKPAPRPLGTSALWAELRGYDHSNSTLALMPEESDELLVADVKAWRQWLEANHATAPVAWVVVRKKGAAAPTQLTFDEALEEAACYGWVDNKSKSRDATTYRLRFTPRRPGSNWTPGNIRIAEALIASGRMQPAGLAEVERARSDGRWGSGPR